MKKGDDMKLLIVEDELAISELMRIHLTRMGYLCDTVYDGEAAIDRIDQGCYDLLLLDIMLPKLDGYDILSYAAPLKIPVIFITAKGSVQDKVMGLRSGADDYLVKPFAIDELIARVESVLRRYHQEERILHVLDITIDTAARSVWQKGLLIELTNKEYELLLYLIRNRNIALYRDVIYQKLWGDEVEESRTLDLHIQRLRKKLGWQNAIKTVFKVGYLLEVAHEAG